MAGFARIHNLGALAAWTAGGTDARPRFEFTASCPAGHSVSSVIIKVYTASAGGVADATYTLIGATLASALANGYYDSAYPMKNKDQASNERWWTIEVTCSNGDTSGESTRTAFKVAWGQAVYEYAVPGGAASSGWQFVTGSLPSNTESAFLYSSSAVSGAPGAWKATIGEVTPNTYFFVLVRLSTYAVGTQPTLPSMEFTYSAAPAQPDQWTFDPVGDWFLDPSVYRYGTKALKFIVDDAADRVLYPFRATSGDDIPVQPNTHYIFTAWVKTDGPLDTGCLLRLEVYASGGFTTLLAQGTTTGESGQPDDPNVGATADTSAYPEGWQRLHLHILTGSGTTSVRPVVRYDNDGGGSGDAGWVDACQFEEGVVASSWHAGQLTNAGIYDGYGLMLDAMEGGRAYLRASDGATATLDDVVHGGGGGGGSDFTIDGGTPTTVYGGTTLIDGGGP